MYQVIDQYSTGSLHRTATVLFPNMLLPISSEIYFIQWFVVDLLTEEWQA